MLLHPDMNVDGVEDTKEREVPGHAVDDPALPGGEELVDECSEKEQMNERPFGPHHNQPSALLSSKRNIITHQTRKA